MLEKIVFQKCVCPQFRCLTDAGMKKSRAAKVISCISGPQEMGNVESYAKMRRPLRAFPPDASFFVVSKFRSRASMDGLEKRRKGGKRMEKFYLGTISESFKTSQFLRRFSPP